MAFQIADPAVESKVERLAKSTGLSKTAVIERALDRLIGETAGASQPARQMAALLAQLDRIPDRPDAFDPLQWDGQGLSKRSLSTLRPLLRSLLPSWSAKPFLKLSRARTEP